MEKEAIVGPEAGLHARPAARFAKKAQRFSSDIRVIKDRREANAKSTLKIMNPGAKKDEKVLIRAEGEDARVARGRQ